MKVQLAIQGGGAKLTTLLAAGSAIQDLQQGKSLELTRIVGTSAGAIVGALLAAGIDIDGFRNELTAGIGRSISSSLSAPDLGSWLRTAMTGRPVWKTDVLESVLKKVFEGRARRLGKTLTTLSDIKSATGVEMRVVVADLRSSRPVVYKPDGNDKEIVTALMDSAGIPIYFRTWKHGYLVDGGLVQNFPWDELLEPAASAYGPIMGISFESGSRESPSGRFEYAGALLNTAMDSATERARTRLGSDRVLTLPSTFDTFDFKKALSDEALGNHFELIKLQTRWFRARLRSSGLMIEADPWSSASISVMEKLGKMYESEHRPTMLKYRNSTLQVACYTLQGSGEPDVVNYSFSFNTTNKDVYCHTVALSQGNKESGSFKKSEITLRDPNGKLIEVDYLPVADSKTPDKREILLFFNSALPPHSGPYTLTVRDSVQGLMGDLLKDRRDVLFTRARRTDNTIDCVRAVLHVPEEYRNVRMGVMGVASELQGRQVPGRAMTPAELVSYQWPTPNWVTIGWMGENVQPNEDFGASIVI